MLVPMPCSYHGAELVAMETQSCTNTVAVFESVHAHLSLPAYYAEDLVLSSQEKLPVPLDAFAAMPTPDAYRPSTICFSQHLSPLLKE